MTSLTLFGFLAVALAAVVAVSGASDKANQWERPFFASQAIPKTKAVKASSSSTTPELIKRYNYTVESYTVKTVDGYLLTLHRIPPSKPNAPVVYLQHGILSSSADWVVLGPEKALAFLLNKAGFDVWMGNFRGNTYSTAHVSLSPKSLQFWDFTWDEMGRYDVPSMIDFILATTKAENLFYVGHSQGATAFLVTASMRPEYNSKVKAFFAMAPLTYMNGGSPFLRFIGRYAPFINIFFDLLGVGPFAPNSTIVTNYASIACADGSQLESICKNALFLISGYNATQLDAEKLPDILQNVPAGTSTKTIMHFTQIANSHRFAMFDRGVLNLLTYGSLIPPEYPLKKITTAVYLYDAVTDSLAPVEDVQRLFINLSSARVRVYEEVEMRNFKHFDFVYGRDSKSLVYDNVINRLVELSTNKP